MRPGDARILQTAVVLDLTGAHPRCAMPHTCRNAAVLLRCRRLSCCAAGCPPQSAASLCVRWRTLRGSVCIDAGDQHRPESDPLTACPRHPGLNFTGFRVQLSVSPTGPVQMNCVVPHDQRARRPSVNWFPLRTMTYNSSANLCSREAVTGTRANLQEVQIDAAMPFAAQARYSCGVRNLVEMYIFVFPTNSQCVNT